MIRIAGVLALVLVLTTGASAQPDITVGDVNFPSLRWGEQKSLIDVTNNSEWVKFIVVETELEFEGTYLHPSRKVRTHHAIAPEETATLEASVLVPGNFGRADAVVKMYDVVDTMDVLMPGQKFFEQPFMLNFHIPDELVPYMQTRIDLPPRVEDHPYFDNEFSRLAFVLLNEGRTAGEMADMAKCDTSFVTSQMELMEDVGFVRKKNDTWALNVAVIRADEAEAEREIAVNLADTLAKRIAAGMDEYRAVLDSLVAVGRVANDSMAFFDPGTVLYRPYAVIGPLALWWDLGREFITRSAPLLIYDGTELCNANIPIYMYAVEGGPIVNGHQFYALLPGDAGYVIHWGDTIPEITCSPDFLRKRTIPIRISYSFEDDFFQENYMVDTTVVYPAIDALTSGTDSLLFDTYTTVRDLAVDKFGHTRLNFGHRYWFWNLVATRTLDLLVERGVVTPFAKGQFQLTGMEFPK